jgi:hypothetical protein
VNDVLQHVGVATVGHGFEEIAANCLITPLEPRGFEPNGCACYGCGPIEQDTSDLWVPAQNRIQQCAISAAYVDYAARRRKIISIDQQVRFPVGHHHHVRIEAVARLPMLLHELENSHPMQMVESRLPGSNRFNHVAPGLPPPRLAVIQRRIIDRTFDVGA